MFKRVGVVVLGTGLLLAAGCSPKPPAAAPTVNDSMTKVMAPSADTIWGVSSHAFNEKGDGLEAAKISQKDWTDLEEAGRLMAERSQILAKAKHVVAAGPNETIMGQNASHEGVKGTWDAASAKQVQALIDAHPQVFAERAQNLANVGNRLVKAAQAKDVNAFYEISANLDEDCDSCHMTFWGTDEPPPFPK